MYPPADVISHGVHRFKKHMLEGQLIKTGYISARQRQKWASSDSRQKKKKKKKKNYTTVVILMQAFRIKPKKIKSLLKGYLAVLKSLQGSKIG